MFLYINTGTHQNTVIASSAYLITGLNSPGYSVCSALFAFFKNKSSRFIYKKLLITWFICITLVLPFNPAKYRKYPGSFHD
ncbi:hypothetical protein Cst_c11800 [Thermoclostridium stercorarium subsp. stercorarium DSM 8532]|uniref:Uncharacterized protein n=2 Tax=Thermoclostridium stercorarium TaxID=1510 RepID=L7VJD6_THES1|nr:hypothetical protein Cst_c11800 [Thermoclostridium stercorarium subsp. stercorarium DSM 8532]ANX01085.1 hypothetical protein CSTERLE_05595 [Thermoclostridium stercorarium subsp. leptospartum DSM 9219]